MKIDPTDFFKRSWGIGLAAGSALALLALLLAFTGIAETAGIERAVGFIAATPLFALDVVFDAPEALQWVLLIVWWAAVGAALGWLVADRPAGIAVAALLAVTVITAHMSTHENIGLKLEGAMRAFGAGVEGLFK